MRNFPAGKVRLFVETPKGRSTVKLAIGQSYRDELRKAGLALIGECDSAMICATCHMILQLVGDADWAGDLYARSDEEQDLLETLPNYGTGSRLSCQTLVSADHQDLTLRLPPSSMGL